MLALVGVLMGVVAGNAGTFVEVPILSLLIESKRAALDAVYFSSERKERLISVIPLKR